MKNIFKNRINAFGVVLVLLLSLGATLFVPAQSTTVDAAKAKNTAQSATLELTSVDIALRHNLMGSVYRVKNINTGAVIENITPDEEGVARVQNLTLGTYEVEQIKEPAGYGINVPLETININSYKKHSLVFEGIILPEFIEPINTVDTSLIPTTVRPGNGIAIEFTVREAFTGQTVSGGVYRVANLDTGVVIENIKPDASGVVRLGNLTTGYYSITEMTAAEGYVTPDTYETIEINNDNETHSFTFYTIDQSFYY